jgi:hypothetical protein
MLQYQKRTVRNITRRRNQHYTVGDRNSKTLFNLSDVWHGLQELTDHQVIPLHNLTDLVFEFLNISSEEANRKRPLAGQNNLYEASQRLRAKQLTDLNCISVPTLQLLIS